MKLQLNNSYLNGKNQKNCYAVMDDENQSNNKHEKHEHNYIINQDTLIKQSKFNKEKQTEKRLSKFRKFIDTICNLK